MHKTIQRLNKPKLITDKGYVSSLAKVKVDEQANIVAVEYLESSQGAGQLVAQLNLHVLRLKPANKDQHVNSHIQSEHIHRQLLQSPKGEDEHEHICLLY